MLDLAVDRVNDHCRWDNVRHPWVLPRRLRMEKAFKVEWPDNTVQNHRARAVRVAKFGLLSLPKSYDQPAASITAPEDIRAFRIGLCVDREWLPFNRARSDSLQGRQRYSSAEPSDKGRYLLGVLGRFQSLPDAFDVLMNGFWRDVLIGLGATPVEKNNALRSELITTLRKRLGQRIGDLNFKTDEDLDRLAREAIRFGRKVGSDPRFISYASLHNKWISLVDADLEKAGHITQENKDYHRDPVHLDTSI